jgi:hypothetical protein
MSNFSRFGRNNETVGENPPFGYLTLFLTLFFLTPATIINILFFFSIISVKAVPGTIRLVLVNIVLASQVVIFGLMGIFLTAVILSGLLYLQPSEIACRLLLSIISGGSAARLLYMATFASVVYILVHHGASKLKFIPSLIMSVVLWILAVPPHFVLLSPEVVGIFFNDGDDCAAYGVGAGTYVYTFSFILIYGLASFTVSVVLALLSLRFVVKNTISGDTTLQKGMIKFALFLLIGNTMNFVGISVPHLIIAFVPLDPSSEAFEELAKNLNLVEGAFLLLSLIPTPIFILAFFRPIRKRFIEIICFVCLKSRKGKQPASQISSGPTPGTASDVL